METTIPYHPGFLLGRSVDMKTVKPRFMLIGNDINPTKDNVRRTTSQFSFAKSFTDVCDVFGCHPEYALKVKAGFVENRMIEECLKDLGKTDVFTIIFRTTFLEQKQFLHPDIVPVSPDSSKEKATNVEDHHTTESLIAIAAADAELSMHDHSKPFTGSLPGKKESHLGTPWVKAVEIGNELVTIMKLSCKVRKRFDKLLCKFENCLENYCAQLDITRMEAIKKLAVNIDKKLSKKRYGNVSLNIWYCSFTELDKYPASLAGMLKTLDTFMDQSTGWAGTNKCGLEYKIEDCTMRSVLGTCKEEKTTVKDSGQHKRHNTFAAPGKDVTYHASQETQKEVAGTNVDGDDDDIVVINLPETQFFYKLRVTLQSLKEGNDIADRIYSPALKPETTNTMFENLFKLQVSCEEAQYLIQDFLSSDRYFFLETHQKEGNTFLQSIQRIHIAVHETVRDLDFVGSLPATRLDSLITADPLPKVKLFIENVTTKLPPGSDIDLLMIGKTGHGKSATGNSILGQEKFLSSDGGCSVTKCTEVGWAEIDGRTIKVIDTPGVYDTNLEGDASSIDLAIKSISEAIANCPEGFHALLIIIRFGVRMTAEERKSIGLLKCVLGEDIVRSHSICVITHGDEFEEKNVQLKTTFEKWCRNERGYLQELLRECNSRCVLFNNHQAADSKTKKRQLIQLVSKVDSLKNSSTRYTNHLFEVAQTERKRLISEENAPQVNEEMMRDVYLIIDKLNNMINDTNAAVQNREEEITRLNDRIEILSKRISETSNEQLNILIRTISCLSETLHMINNKPVDLPLPASPRTSEDTPEMGMSTTKKEPPINKQYLQKPKVIINNFKKTEMESKNDKITKETAKKVEEEIKKGKACFPGNSVVTLSSGKSVPLEELQVGDKVLVRDNAGQLSFDTVYMFGHKEFETSNEFIAMKAGSQNVYVTAEHYVYCVKREREVCVAAKDVQVGDCLLVVTSEGLMPQPVEMVTFENKRGLFAPFTNSGSIIIDGVLMSCYINVLSHKACHTLMWPVRQLYRISPGTLSQINGSYSQYPVPRWAKAALKLM